MTATRKSPRSRPAPAKQRLSKADGALGDAQLKKISGGGQNTTTTTASNSSSGGTTTEQVSLNFTKVKMEY